MGWLRNYGAMGDRKLLRTIEELASGDTYTEAVKRVIVKGGSIDENRTKAEYEARKKGLIDSNFIAIGTNVMTEKKFCPECEKSRKFYLDDYICHECRDEIG